MKTTKEHMKKLISMLVVLGLVTSQLGCGRKPLRQNISAPIDQVKFEKDYKYSVQLKTGEKTQAVSGDQIQTKPNELVLESDNQSKSLMSQDIKKVNGVGTKRVGSYAGAGFAIGGGTGLLTGITLAAVHATTCKDNRNGHTEDGFGCGFGTAIILITTPGMALLGGGLGAIVGAFISKHDKVQITPIVSPTAQGGVDAGVNVGFKF
ncbi:MAG: hypothetical protein R2877_05705 [Bdellovibrionota bacterium]